MRSSTLCPKLFRFKLVYTLNEAIYNSCDVVSNVKLKIIVNPVAQKYFLFMAPLGKVLLPPVQFSVERLLHNSRSFFII